MENTTTDIALGTTLTDRGCHFRLHGPQLENLFLVLPDHPDEHETAPEMPRLMQKQSNGDWTCFVSHVQAGAAYAFYTLNADNQKQWLLDPHAHHVLQRHDKIPFWTAQVTDHYFDWGQAQPPKIPAAQTILCEVHVKGFTALHPDIPPAIRGTYLALCHPVTIVYFKRHGITTLQLMPIATKADETHLQAKSLTNYWGYNPLAWSAPDSRFASENPVEECKTMIRTLHEHGIEVILDVVYNHTAEEGHGGPVFHFKALDPQTYRHSQDGQLLNYTGCGNTVNLQHPPALAAVIQSLRSWVTHYQVDGFRFDLALTLGRNGESFDQHAAFFQAIQADPVLSQVKLIAEPWDIGPQGYQLGHFPDGWHECNDVFRDTWRSYWLHNAASAEIAPLLLGTQSLFPASHWPSKMSVNYICYHDGFTLQDVVSYHQRHNQANLEQNRDGHPDNRSHNLGIEGPTRHPGIMKKREQHKRNLMTSLIFSFGMPHLLGADLRAHSQQGNNNAYCQDNPVSWVNWDSHTTTDQFAHGCVWLIQQRQATLPRFIQALTEAPESVIIHWHVPNGSPMTASDWSERQPFACRIQIQAQDSLCYLFNPGNLPVHFQLQGTGWHCLVDTALHAPEIRKIRQSGCLVRGQSMMILHNNHR
ncbi:glycogen-debranching protein [Photobacterium sp. 1_MG-2023]|uniref:glycogen debranching protein n=1 Tax=Photobacterium sp. 1_MG-2023 TaxID=3062646 RepID=UPI0026E2D764|nr:alpha-amylase family glycosyl hydrolase [Photobacterium sp. 1_MG-2023]MDO6705949.1 alpha-amylase family glycosyl hydrolase [Photobacterium sp. 1_MG-2023]